MMILLHTFFTNFTWKKFKEFIFLKVIVQLLLVMQGAGLQRQLFLLKHYKTSSLLSLILSIKYGLSNVSSATSSTSVFNKSCKAYKSLK